MILLYANHSMTIDTPSMHVLYILLYIGQFNLIFKDFYHQCFVFKMHTITSYMYTQTQGEGTGIVSFRIEP